MTADPSQSLEIFKHGSAWLRVDFHLHTKQDKSFTYNGDEDRYGADYVQGLEKAGINVGVISNHNKFDYREFKALRRIAKRKEIYLIPGVELSVNDGANGIHTIVVFSDEWLGRENDYINPFLTGTFAGKTPDEYENGNTRSSDSLIETIKKLEDNHKDFFIVFAHVEEKRGLWNEVDGGRLQELGKNEFFRRRVLAFQKVRTHDVRDRPRRVKIQDWLGDAYPAEVEGSDPKAIDQIGRGRAGFLKMGDFNFETVKYALLDRINRIAASPRKHENSYIFSASFEGGVLSNKTINFSPELNTMIGIRGSGKSSILEAVRYALDIPFGEKTEDRRYKTDLVEHTLGSGGKITVQAVDKRGRRYEIRRILNEEPDVYIDGQLQPGISIRETILHKPIYFGQKDLSSTGDGFEKDLVEKLVGEKLADIRTRIDEQRQKVAEAVNRLKTLSDTDAKRKEYTEIKQDAEYLLEFYREYGVEEKLQKQVDFDTDSRKCSQVVSFIRNYLNDFEDFINRYEDDLKNSRVFKSRQNEYFFNDFLAIYDNILESFGGIKRALLSGKETLIELEEKASEFEEIKVGFKEEFADIERKLSGELKDDGAKAIRPEEFRQLRTAVNHAKQMLDLLDKQESQRNDLDRALQEELTALNDLWHEEFKLIQSELAKVRQHHSSLDIKIKYKGDKKAFIEFMKDIFRGSRLRETTFQALARQFHDFGGIFRNREQVEIEIGPSTGIFGKYFMENLPALLTWQVPNLFTIEYRGKELKHHSLGQRASALILFVLSQRENDVIIIDQPEDDLDNQTIYEDVIKLVRELKPVTQFIFVTHNANFPVLGDAEQIFSCTYSDDSISVTTGSIDRPQIQQEIVDIMEGGEEAFKQRKRIYEIWKSRNSWK